MIAWLVSSPLKQYLGIVLFFGVMPYVFLAVPLYVNYWVTQWWKRNRKGSQVYLPFHKRYLKPYPYQR